MRSQKSPVRRGFTLIELLTVIAIIGILAGMVIGVTQIVRVKARVAASKQMFAQWCTAVEQYKTTYSQYPNINNQYETSSDTVIRLNNQTSVSQFIKCLTGRQPVYQNGAALSPEDRRKFNRQSKEFVTFDKNAFQMSDNGAYTQLLKDSFDNTNITLVMDTDGNGMVHPTDTMPDDSGADNNGNIGNKVIIYTLKSTASNPADAQDILSWQ